MCSHAERISSVCLAKPGTTSVRQLVCFAATSRADIFDCVTWCKPAGHSISKLPLHIDKAAAQLYYQAAEPKISIVFLISCMFMSFTLNLVVRPRLLDSLDPYCLTTSTTCSPLCDHRHRPLGHTHRLPLPHKPPYLEKRRKPHDTLLTTALFARFASSYYHHKNNKQKRRMCNTYNHTV